MKNLFLEALTKAKHEGRKSSARSAHPLLKLCALLMFLTSFSLQSWGQVSITEGGTIKASEINVYSAGGAGSGSNSVVSFSATSCYKNLISGSNYYISLQSGNTFTISTSSGHIDKIVFSPHSDGGGTAGRISVNTGVWDGNDVWESTSNVSSVTFTTTNQVAFRSFTFTVTHSSSSTAIKWDGGNNPISISCEVEEMPDIAVNFTGTTSYTVQDCSISGVWGGNEVDNDYYSAYSLTPLTISALASEVGVFNGTLSLELQISNPYSRYIIEIPITLTVTGCATPAKPVISTPITTTYNSATITWGVASNATKYDLKIGTTSGGSEFATYNNLTSTSQEVTGLTTGATYYATVIAKNDCGVTTTTSNSVSFTPTCPTVTSVTASSTAITANSATISWSASSVGGGDLTYRVIVNKSGTSDKAYDQSGLTTTSVNVTGLESNTTYKVYVQATNTCGNSNADYGTAKNTFTTSKNYVNYVYTCIDLDLVQTDGATTIPLYITSAAGQTVKATRTLTMTIDGASANAPVNISGTNLKFYKPDGTEITSSNLLCDPSGELSQEIYVAYNPTSYVSEIRVTPSINVSCDGNNLTFSSLVTARCLPENFVIAAKWGGNWYALPANCTTSSSSTAGIPIIVNDVDDPSSATALSTTKYGLREVASTRYAANGANLTFTERLTTATANSQKTLYNGSKTSIQVNAQYSNYTATNPERYEWLPTTTDMKDYLLTSVATLTGEDAEAGEKPRTISINNSGVFGTLMQDKAYDGKVRLLPATFVEPAEMQVVEWKASSVVIMYLGNATTATTTVGSNPSSGTQTLASQEMMHGVYELTTNEALTSNAGKTLIITMSDATQKLVVVPMIVSGATTASEDVANDVVVLNGGTLTAATTKHTFKNVTVYGGGKLSIPSGTSIGMSSLTLRAGNLTTNGTGGSVAYSYDYPQVALTGTLTNTAAKINLDYITDYDHWYHLTVPFAAKLKDITRPTEFYGSAVAANNNGSWEIDCYDGSIRATGVYDSWQDIEGAGYLGTSDTPTERALTAGQGYMMWAAPLKVQKTGESEKTRQTYGIHRFVMHVAADAAKTAETTDKTVTVYAHPAEKNNDYGWNMVGNPYMANLSEMASTTLKVGELVKEMKDDKWTGKWIWDKDTQTQNYRYVTVPANDFSSYEAVKVKSGSDAETVSLSPFKVFFIQVDGETANQEKSLVFDHTKRAASIASYTRLISEEVETGMIMQHANYADEKLGFLLSDEYSDAYEKQADYPKMMNPTNYNLYGVHEVGELSFVATSPTIASTSMAIGYQVPEAGDYTLSFDENGYDRDEVKNLYVTDYGVEPSVTTDLMEKDYIFHVNEAETNNTRFVVSIVLTPKEPDDPGVQTSLEAVDGQNHGPIKFIYQDKMYILSNGVIYDAMGKRVSIIKR